MKPSSGERYEWIDLLRGTAVILVVVHHATIHTAYAPRVLLWFDNLMANYRMPMLLVISGLLLNRSLAKPAAVFISGKLRAIVWPWILWAALLLPLVGWDKAVHPGWWFYGEYNHTWFLAVLSILYLLGLITRKVPSAVVSGLALVGAVVLPESAQPLEFLASTLWWAFFFFAGDAISSHLSRIARLPAWLAVLALLVTVGWTVFTVKQGQPQTRYLLAAAMALLGVLLASWIAARVQSSALSKPGQWFGRRSIVTYLLNWPYFLIIERLFGHGVGWGWFLFLLSSALLVCSAAVASWPVTRWLFQLPRCRTKTVAV